MEIIKVPLRWYGTLKKFTRPIEKLVLHHMAHPTWTFQDVHKFHRDGRNWFGIGYNYWIGFDGKIYEGRGNHVGAHAHAKWNPITYGIGFQGDFDKNDNMTDAQVNSAIWLVSKLMKEHNLKVDDIVGHKDVNTTLCPGRYFRMDDIKNGILRGNKLPIDNVKEVDYLLKIGDKGTAVANYQTVLIKLGYDLGSWGADGSFGPHTEKVTKEAQKDYGIKQDGILRADLYGFLALELADKTIVKENKFVPFLARVDVDVLNVRSKPDDKSDKVTKVKRNDVYTIVDVDGEWGKLKSGRGWIFLGHTKKV